MDMDDRIEQYILNRMTKSERIEFERELQNNPLLKEQVEMDQEIVMQIRSQANVDKQIKQAKEELMQEKFEAYILNLMTEIEKTEFENDLNNNPLLKEQLELEQSLVGQIRGHAFAEEQISTAKKEMKKGKIIRMASYSLASIAASFLLFFFGYSFYQNREMNQQFAFNFSAYTNDYIATDGSYRGDVEIDSLLLSAMRAYEMRDYPLAEAKFNQHLTEKDNPEIRFYLAITQMGTGKTKEALKTLHLLYSQPIEYRYYEQTRWYLALVQLKLHEKGEAKKYLEELVALDGVYWEKAKLLFNKLQ
jgi:hypothetical protein